MHLHAAALFGQVLCFVVSFASALPIVCVLGPLPGASLSSLRVGVSGGGAVERPRRSCDLEGSCENPCIIAAVSWNHVDLRGSLILSPVFLSGGLITMLSWSCALPWRLR